MSFEQADLVLETGRLVAAEQPEAMRPEVDASMCVIFEERSEGRVADTVRDRLICCYTTTHQRKCVAPLWCAIISTTRQCSDYMNCETLYCESQRVWECPNAGKFHSLLSMETVSALRALPATSPHVRVYQPHLWS